MPRRGRPNPLRRRAYPEDELHAGAGFRGVQRAATAARVEEAV